MASIALNYDSIDSAAKHAKKVASTAEDYVLKLQKKIINDIDSLSGVSTSYTTEAKMNVSKKMMHLYDKRDIYEDYGLKLEQFIENEEYGAKAVDQRVVELFQSEGAFPKKKKENSSIVNKAFTFLSNAVQTVGEFTYNVLLDISDAVNWVFQLPAFSGKSVDEIAEIMRDAGYDVTVKASTRSRSGAQIIKINNPGNGKNISQVQVSPGGGRHGSNPYIKISTTDQGIIKIIDGPEILYKTDGKETATIIFSGGK
ncbi:hypothetical protein [Anaerosporobacter faecicola]|uniref:hypothetical protein n=1 Tax=Anaerosporobacter faecicola TaxID=2718714 RepID=UPI00143AF74B|nr:hypothetical protein [Anaerosporobacter faecicola]